MLEKVKAPLIKRLFLILFIAIFLQFFLSLSLNIFGYYVDLRDGVFKNIDDKLDKIKTSLERLTTLGIPLKEMPPINEELEKETKDEFTLFLAVTDAKGNIIFHSDPLLVGTKLEIDIDDANLTKPSKSFIQPFGVVNILYKPIIDGKMSKTGYIIAAYKTDIIYKKVFFVFLRMSIASALAGSLGLFLIYFFYKRDVSSQLNRLLEQVNKIREGTFEELDLTQDETEFSTIIEGMNKMVRELKNGFQEKEELLLKLSKEEEKLRKIIEKTEIGMAVIKDERIVFVNPGFYKIFNFTAEKQVVGQYITNLIPEESILIFRDILREVIDRGENIQIDSIKLIDLEKNEIYCSLEATLLETSEWGKRVISLTFQNITEKVKFTRELQQKNKELENLINKYQTTQIALQIANEKLENALITIEKANEEFKKIDNLKDVFFSTISHELKTPISLIQGYISIIKGDPAIKRSNISSDIIDSIERASKRLLNLTEEIMELLKIKSGKITLNLSLTSIKLLLQALIPEFDHFLKSKNIELTLNNIDNLPLISVDAKRIETTLRNLIINAIKFTKEGGKIVISGDTVEEDGVTYIKLSIKDEGCGISKFNLDKVFVEFFTLPPPPDIAKTPTMKGSGLGLSIAKGFIEAHKGKIWAESEGYDPEKFPGATFFIMLPIADKVTNSLEKD